MVQTPEIRENDLHDDISVEVEQRLHRLEAAVTALKDTPLMEERVVDKVIQRLKKTPIKNLRDAVVTPEETKDPAAVPPPEEDHVETVISAVPEPKERRGWFLFELLGELRTMRQMTFDHRYQFSWIGRVAPIVIITIYVLLWWMIGSTFPFGIIERLIDIVLIVLLYHILAREARRYRDRQSNR